LRLRVGAALYREEALVRFSLAFLTKGHYFGLDLVFFCFLGSCSRATFSVEFLRQEYACSMLSLVNSSLKRVEKRLKTSIPNALQTSGLAETLFQSIRLRG